MATSKRQRPKKKTNPRGRPAGEEEAAPRIHAGRDVTCADLIGRDKVTRITYGYSPRDIERLIEKVLAFVQAGAAFLPLGSGSDALRAELDGETLTFPAGALNSLAARGNERPYLLSPLARRDYQIWATKFIPLAAKMDVRRVVEGLNLPIAYSEFRPPREGEGGQPSTVPLENILDAVQRHSAFIILGEPGAGKTTTLQKLAFEAAQTRVTDAGTRLPLLVRLSQQKMRSPYDFLEAEWTPRLGKGFDRALAEGRLLILADGVNELPRGEERAERLKDWRVFLSDHLGSNQIIFTSRAGEYDQLLDLPRVIVEPLDDERIHDYLQRNNAEGLRALLDDAGPARAPLRQMAANPFNLSLLVHAYKSNQREMGNRGRLLEWFVGELFAREERLGHRGWIHRAAQTQALAQLAFTMQAQGKATTVEVKVARTALPASVEVNGDEVNVRPADLFRFARQATLLDPAIEPDVRFYHQLLQEYFAALELLRRFDEAEDLSALWRIPRGAEEMPPAEVGEWDPLPSPPATGWGETTLVACGLARDPSALIEAVRPHHPALAARCFTESGIPAAPLSTLQSQVQQDLLRDLYSPAQHLRARLQAGEALGRLGDPRFEPKDVVFEGKPVRVIAPQTVAAPAGTYVIGSGEIDSEAFEFERPQHPVELPAFVIGRWPVTNAEYACFMDAGGYKDERWWKTGLAKRWLKGEDVMGGQASGWRDYWQFIRRNPDWRDQLAQTGNYSPSEIESYEVFEQLEDDVAFNA